MKKYAKNITRSARQTANGIDLLGFRASSPAVAITSKPMNPQKQMAAPLMTPSNPYGRKPPLPNPGGTSDAGIAQLQKLILMDPAIITNKTMLRFENVTVEG